MGLAPAAEVGDMSSCNPDRVPDAARALRERLNSGYITPTLLRAQMAARTASPSKASAMASCGRSKPKSRVAPSGR